MSNEDFMHRALRMLAIAVTATTLIGCAVHGDEYERHDRRHAQRHDAPVAIPKGHMPPPGECRIWYPERPPGQQPPPGDCRELRHHVPHGAQLIRG